MPKNRAKVLRKAILRLLLELLPMVNDVISDEGLRVDHSYRLLKSNMRTFTQNRESEQLIGKQILCFVIPDLPQNKILLLGLQLKLQHTNLLALVPS